MPTSLATRPRTALPEAGPYRLVAETCVAEFAVKHLLVATARGRVAAADGLVVIDGSDRLASWVRVDLDASSLRTGSTERDAALCGPDCLAAEEFPVIRFESTCVEETGPDRFTVWGDLYIRDVVGEVALDARVVTAGEHQVTFAGRTSFSRSAFGLTWAPAVEKVGVVISDVVKITVAAEFTTEARA